MKTSRIRIGFVIALGTVLAAQVTSSCGGDDAGSPGGADDASTDGATKDVTQSDGSSRDANVSDGSTPTDGAIIDSASTPSPISAGLSYTCAIIDGGVDCWGSNADGELGGGASPGPGPTSPFVPASVLSAGWSHACASDGTNTQCWGYNNDGELGRDASTTAVGPLVGLSGTVTDLGMGWFHSCALSGGNVSCWGLNDFGELGVEPDGSAFDGITHVPLPGDADQIAIGIQAGCARLVSDHSIWCWGGNHMGELALPFDGGFSATPVRVGTFTGVLQITSGIQSICALLSDRTVTCWGRNAAYDDGSLSGMLGHDPTTDEQCSYGKCDPTPTAVPGLTDVTEIAAGGGQTCAVNVAGNVFCWGSNEQGQLGHDPSLDIDGGPDNLYSFTPTLVGGLTNVVHLAAGITHNCAVTAGQKIFCWGSNNSGELGSSDGAAMSFSPVEVTGF